MRSKKDNKTKHKLVIDKYEQNIYPVTRIYVLKNYTLEDLNKNFASQYNKSISIPDDYDALVYNNITDKDNKLCAVVLLNQSLFSKKKDKSYLVKVCAHEAAHAALWMFKYIGQEVSDDNSNEPFAYLLEYITECIYNTANK